MESIRRIDNIPKYVSALVPVILTLSVVYDLGYFGAFGLTFSEVPTTISDHLRSSLIWLPIAILCVFFIMVLELFTRRLEKGKSESEIINDSPNPKRTAFLRKSPVYLITAVTFAIPIASMLGVPIPMTGWMFFSIILWFLFHNFAFGHERILEQTSRTLWLLTRWAPAVILWVLFSGFISAQHDRDSSDTLEIKVSHGVIDRVVLRAYDKFYVLYDPITEEVTLLNNSEVKSIVTKLKK
ncbi:hypothetical protein ACI1G1_003551 [Vibrio cholerae]